MDLFGRKKSRRLEEAVGAGMQMSESLTESFKKVYKETYGTAPSCDEALYIKMALIPFFVLPNATSVETKRELLGDNIDKFASAASYNRGKIALALTLMGEIVFSENMSIRPGYEWALKTLNEKTSRYLN